MEAKPETIVRVVVVCERHDGDFTREDEFDLFPEEVDVVAPLILAMRRVHPPGGDSRG